MDFVDATLLKLTQAATRSALFDDEALGQMVAAVYDPDVVVVQAPYNGVFDELRFGQPLPRSARVDGTVQLSGANQRYDFDLRLDGLGLDGSIRVDAIWRGAIVARVAPATAQVLDVRTKWPSPGAIDAAIVTALGALPSDPILLEAERRPRFLVALRAALAQPNLLTEALFDRWLASVGATSVSDFFERVAPTLQAGAVQLRFSAPAALDATPRRLPIAAAFLIRDRGFSLAQLLCDSKQVRRDLEHLGLERPADPKLPARTAVLVTWLVPSQVFDDDAWPGAAASASAEVKRAMRRRAAGTWLAREGIGLVVV